MLADAEDEELLKPHGWAWLEVGRETKCRYAYVGGSKDRVYAHRLVMRLPRGRIPEVDHINGDGLDNRRSNLRVVSHALNLANQRPQIGRSSPYKGVSWCKRHQDWEASIKVRGRKIHLGHHRDEIEAALTYDIAALDAWGEYSRPNFEW